MNQLRAAQSSEAPWRPTLERLKSRATPSWQGTAADLNNPADGGCVTPMLSHHARAGPAVTHSPCVVVTRSLRRGAMPLFPGSTRVSPMAFHYVSVLGIVLGSASSV